MDFKIFTCANFEHSAAVQCPYKVIGEKGWVIEKARDHVMIKHGNEDTLLLKQGIIASLIDAAPVILNNLNS